MRSFFVALATAATLVAAQLRIETPTNLVVCQPALLSWAGGKAPYYVSVIPGGDPSGAALKDFGETSDRKLTWNVDLPAGREVSLRISDSTGDLNYSEKVTIREGSNTNCLNGASASSGASGASGASSAAGGASTSAGGAASSASSAVASGASSASGAVSSATGAAGSSASSVSSRAAGAGSSATSATNAAGNAAASATSTGAASLGAKVQYAGVLGAVAAIFGVALF